MSMPTEITSDDSLNQIAAHWIKLTRRIAGIDEESEVLAARAVLARAAARKKELTDELGASQAFFEPLAGKYAANKLKGTGSRTYAAALVEIAFKACNQIVVSVLDAALATPFVLKHCPEAIESKPTVKVGKFTTAFREFVAKKTKAGLANAGLAVVLPHDNVHFTLKG